MKKKIISLFLSVAMVLTMVPSYMVAFADDEIAGTTTSEGVDNFDIDEDPDVTPDPDPDPEDPSDDVIDVDCTHTFTDETIPDASNAFWDSHSSSEYYVGSSALVAATLPANCEEDGWSLAKSSDSGFCAVCGNFVVEGNAIKADKIINHAVKITAKGHNFTVPVSEATCTDNAVKECSNTNYSIKVENKDGVYVATLVSTDCTETQEEEGSALGHDMVEVTAEVPAGCTTTGTTAYSECSRCDATEGGEEIPALDHDFVLVSEKVEATCTVAGSEAYYECSRCDATQGGEEITPPGHSFTNYVSNDDVTYTFNDNDTCTVAWTETAVCDNGCGTTATVDKSDTVDHVFDEDVITEATCYHGGVVKYTCQNCDYQYIAYPDALEHTGLTVTKEPTCTDSGLKEGECENCGRFVQESIEPLGHDYQLDEEASTEVSCTEDGKTVYTCSRCDESFVSDLVLALGHDLQLDTDEIAPDCVNVGYTALYKCSRCDYTEGGEEIPALGHDFGEYVSNEDVEYVTVDENQCYATWTETATCQRDGCDETTTRTVKAAAEDHTFALVEDDEKTYASTCTSNGQNTYACTKCGYEKAEQLPLAPHQLTITDSSEPKCEHIGTSGYNVYTCTTCGQIINIEYLDPVPANFDANGDGEVTADDAEVTVEPTCTTEGELTYYCQNDGCDYSYTETLDALGHLVPDSYDEVANCVHGNQYVCQREFSDGSICNTFVEDDARNYNLTFTEDSDIQAVDSVDIPDEEIPEGADLYVSPTDDFAVDYGTAEDGQLLTGHNYDVKLVKARCEFDKYYLFTCTNEGCPDSEDTVNEVFIVAVPNTATGHNWALRDDNTNTDPSCTVDGTRNYYCLNDHSHVYTEKLPATGHNYVLTDTVDATCTEGGYNLYVCQNTTNDNDLDSEKGTVCGDSYKVYITAPIAHNYVVTDKVAATCTEEGYEVYTCDMCKEATYTKTTTPAKGHNYVVTSSTSATCTTEGYDTYTCTVCDDTYNKTTTPANGHNYVVTSSTPATCTTEGYDTYTCTVCDDTYNKTTTHATGHTFVATAFKDATCTEAGYTTYSCINNDCTESYNADYKSAKGHSFVADVTAPTCTEEGYTTFTCDVCGETRKDADGNVYKTNVTKPVNHVLNTVSTVAPTCGKDGKKVSECENCDYVQEEVIPATGDHKYSDAVTTPATCGADGVMNHVCDVCGYSYTTVIPATGDHKYDEKITTAPTCKEKGEKLYTCSVCGYQYSEELAKTDDHQYDEKITTSPTCKDKGEKLYTCSVCGNTYTEEIDKTDDHQYTDVIVTPATCAEDGVMNHVCDVCEESYTTVIPATGDHKYESVITKQPTCVEVGEATLTCSECGNVVKEELPVTADHAYNRVYTAPTCTAWGYYTYTCRDCGKTYVQETNDAPTGHSYVSKVTPATTSKNGKVVKTCELCGKSSTTTIAKIASVTLSQTKFTYSGKSITPIVKVTDSNGKKVANTNYTVTYSKNKAVGTATVTIKFNGTYYSGTVKKTFTINPKNVGISDVSSSKKGQIRFTWGKVAVCDGYQIQYSTSSSFKDAKSVTVKGAKNCVKTLTGLKSGKKYYIRIRSYKTVDGKKYYSDWSKTSKTCK
jgi:hypothetical protein